MKLRASVDMRHWYSAVGLICVTAACGPYGGSNTDSDAGDKQVMIEMNGQDAQVVRVDYSRDLIWSTLSSEGDPDDELVVSPGFGLVRLSDGSYLISEGNRMRVFDDMGSEVWRFGREGTGPDELGSMSAPCRLHGDTVVAFDQRNARLVAIIPKVGLVMSEPSGTTGIRPDACSGHGWFLAARAVRGGDDGPTMALIVRDLSRDNHEEVSRLVYAEQVKAGFGQPSFGMMDSNVYVADPNHGSVKILSRHGELLREFLWNEDRVKVTDASLRQRYGGVDGARWARLPRMKYWPAFGNVRAGHGMLWVQEFTIESGVDSWVAVSMEGQVIMRIEFPEPSLARSSRFVGFVGNDPVVVMESADGTIDIGVLNVIEK